MFSYHIDAAARLARIVLSGPITGQTFTEALIALARDPQWQPGFRRLWDCREVTSSVITLEEVEQYLAQSALPISYAGRAAMVASREAEQSIARLAGARIKQYPVRVFASYHAAMQWLLEPDAA